MARRHIANPATSVMVPVNRAMRAPPGATRSALIAAVITNIIRVSMSPAAMRTAMGAAQLSAQAAPNR